MLLSSALVGVGGFFGSIARYFVTLVFRDVLTAIPAGTLFSNLAGCFCIGLITALAQTTVALSPQARLLLATGFCGGFTTMSAMVFETAQYLRTGRPGFAGIYLAGTIFGSMMTFYAGTMVIKQIFKGIIRI